MSEYRIVIVRSGQPRAPLFPGHWDKIGPLVKLVIDATCKWLLGATISALTTQSGHHTGGAR
jgi:hypothetical protein